jgi:[glutamine synthetase] adenylyltransferase / [glutamine synthetase]-adenylyl-L-tyrosine phosphorylase
MGGVPTIEFLLRDLPDQNGARLFLDRLSNEQPRAYRNLVAQPALLADALALAAWSPLLATTLEQNPEYFPWLARERAEPRVRSLDELKESLARFALTNSSLNPQNLLARFRRRELLRTYLHDIRRSHTLVETMEELSNLADAILDYALSLARQDLDNRYGSPQHVAERGRIATAEFCVVALGKLGSMELNYASDIDLVFLYSDDGTTSGIGQRGEVSNREYFVKLSETIARLVGQSGGEGAAYRVDLRLRPHGRDGSLACSLAEAARYYMTSAQDWERQALIRSRAAAGSAELFSQFKEAVTPYVFRPDVSVSRALESVRLAKQKIDRQTEKKSGYNVKLGRGGIREIEFIAQALQLAHGGRDDWLRVPHTLVSLGRLADREFITQQERSELSDAYCFLRTLEHRLQMEHGLQTHTVPNSDIRYLIARRLGFSDLDHFLTSLALHTANVRRTYDRLFGDLEHGTKAVDAEIQKDDGDKDLALALSAARVFVAHTAHAADVKSVAQSLRSFANESLNPHRALVHAARIAASLEKTDRQLHLTQTNLRTLLRVCGASDFFAEMIAANPALTSSLGARVEDALRRDYRAILRAAIDAENSFPAELAALRHKWAELIAEIGALDIAGELSIFDTNRLQTELAIASLNVSYLIARREMARRYGSFSGGPRIAIYGLGRLGSAGVDYGSDLDVLFTYDSMVPSPIKTLTQDETYSRLVEFMIAALSSITRAGYLYRVDLRLRPHGKNGPLVTSAEGFLDYLKEESAPWEWLAYVKLRAVGGDLELGKMIETHARHRIHETALRFDPHELKLETRRVRDRLEKEKGTRGRRAGIESKRAGIDIKYGPGGMLDVYFATRYLQLRDEVVDGGDDRSTAFTLERLREEGSLTEEDFSTMSTGYSLLRSIDHNLRLIVGRSTRLPDPNHVTARDVALRMGFSSATELHQTLREQMQSIRDSYNRILD